MGEREKGRERRKGGEGRIGRKAMGEREGEGEGKREGKGEEEVRAYLLINSSRAFLLSSMNSSSNIPAAKSMCKDAYRYLAVSWVCNFCIVYPGFFFSRWGQFTPPPPPPRNSIPHKIPVHNLYLPSSPLKGSCLLMALPGSGGTRIWNKDMRSSNSVNIILNTETQASQPGISYKISPQLLYMMLRTMTPVLPMCNRGLHSVLCSITGWPPSTKLWERLYQAYSNTQTVQESLALWNLQRHML